MNVFERHKAVFVIAGVLALAIAALIVVDRLTTDRSSDAVGADRGHGACAVARRALEAFDAGRAPPAEWIQDRAAAAEAVRKCEGE